MSGKAGSGKKNQSHKAWIHEHVNDAWVQKARAEGLRSRAAFKLAEIADRDRLLRPGMTVVDLGSAPGSWSQVVARRVAPGGSVIALDILPMEAIHGVRFIQGDFREDAVLAQLVESLGGRQADLVLSDMAPNLSGVAVVDQARAMALAELALDFCSGHLKPGGDFLIKVFQGEGFMELRKAIQERFAMLQVRKPAASRDRSAELYLLARGRRG